MQGSRLPCQDLWCKPARVGGLSAAEYGCVLQQLAEVEVGYLHRPVAVYLQYKKKETTEGFCSTKKKETTEGFSIGSFLGHPYPMQTLVIEDSCFYCRNFSRKCTDICSKQHAPHGIQAMRTRRLGLFRSLWIIGGECSCRYSMPLAVSSICGAIWQGTLA